MKKPQRKLRNLLISPKDQLPIITYTLLLGLLLTQGLLFSIENFRDSVEQALMSVPETPSSLNIDQLNSFILERTQQFIFNILLFALICFWVIAAALLLETHKLFGAAYRIKNFISQKMMKEDYSETLRLRKKDYLKDLAEVVDKLKEKLKKKH